MSDLLQAIISGNPLELPGLGSNNGGLTILFPLSLGNTVTDLANTLNVPVDSILAVNPGLRGDSPLAISQVIGLPEGHVDHIMRSLDPTLGRTYGTSPSSSPPGAPPTISIPHESHPDSLFYDCMRVVPPLLRSMQTALDMFNTPGQDARFTSQDNEAATSRWLVSVAPPTLPIGISEPHDVPTAITSISVLSLASASTQASSLALPPTSAPAQAASAATPAPELSASSIDPHNVMLIAASSQERRAWEGAVSVASVEKSFMQAAQDRQRNPVLNPPPPTLMEGGRFAGRVTWAVPPSSNVGFVPPIDTQNTMAPSTDSRPVTLQLIALMMAQSAGSAAADARTVVPSQGPSFVDPQAVAALAATMRATKVVDLGAGRSMEFSLVADRMRRIDPIGQEDRPSLRRTGDGLEEVRVRCPDGEDVEQTDEQREQGRRRRAAIAAMRRRRRPRSRRCRYWHGTRHNLRPSGEAHYPKRVDFAEFRSRQPPRYMWNVGSES